MKPVNCKHWTSGNIVGGGVCRLNLYGGKPSVGICNAVCPSREPIVGKVLHRATKEPRPVQPEKFGPGDLVKIIIAKIGYKQTADCGCNAMRRRMNALGWWGCYKNRTEIIDWFVSQAAKNNVMVTNESVWGLLRAGMHEYWKNDARVPRDEAQQPTE